MTSGHQIDIDGYYLNIDWDIGNYTLTSVTGYREQESRLPSSYGSEAVTLFDATRDDNRETFQQELRLASNLQGNFNFVAGLFYQTDETSFNVLQYLGLLDFFGIGVNRESPDYYEQPGTGIVCAVLRLYGESLRDLATVGGFAIHVGRERIPRTACNTDCSFRCDAG